MIKLGEIQTLVIKSLAPIGVYLNEETPNSDNILLPRKYVPDNAQLGDLIDVFIYLDSEDRIIATTLTPKITINSIAQLEVVSTTNIGAFLDWGLEKDLFLPFKEQLCSVNTGEKYLFGLYIDKSNRLCATMKIYSLLLNDSPYKEDDFVSGFIYDINNTYGAFVAIDHKYNGLIPQKEIHKDLKIGDEFNGRVYKVRDDNKLLVSLRDKAYKEIDNDAQLIIAYLEKNSILPLNDKSSPEEIKRTLSISKKAFKRAVGRLLKENKIMQTDKDIRFKS